MVGASLWQAVSQPLHSALQLAESVKGPYEFLLTAVKGALDRLHLQMQGKVHEVGKEVVREHGLQGSLAHMETLVQLTNPPPCVSDLLSTLRAWIAVDVDQLSQRPDHNDHALLTKCLSLYIKLGGMTCPWLSEVAQERFGQIDGFLKHFREAITTWAEKMRTYLEGKQEVLEKYRHGNTTVLD